jgi:hypothetical protein
MSLSLNRNLPRINPLSGKNNWRGIEKTTRKFFKSGKQESSAKMLEKEFQKAHINESKRDKGRQIVQDMILEGRIAEDKAKGLMNELGYTGSKNERFKKFESLSENLAEQRKQRQTETAKQGAADRKDKKIDANKEAQGDHKDTRATSASSIRLDTTRPRNRFSSDGNKEVQKKASTVWEILNKQQNLDHSPLEDQKKAA